MGSNVKHAPGTFCWAELTTSDPDSAKKFYTDLMGWETHDDRNPGGGVYTMIRQAGGDVGAMFQINEEMKAAGVPPHWMAYITVEDAAATAAKAKELGGTIAKDAFSVMDVGSMAVLLDPMGAPFSVWQPKRHTGYDFADSRPGTVCWNELMTSDAGRAAEFYSTLFGWVQGHKDMGPAGTYTIFKQGDTQIGGMMQIPDEFAGMPPHWMVYFAVEDCDGSAEKVKSLGGDVRVPPTDIPEIGRFALACDPQGAPFSFIKLG